MRIIFNKQGKHVTSMWMKDTKYNARTAKYVIDTMMEMTIAMDTYCISTVTVQGQVAA